MNFGGDLAPIQRLDISRRNIARANPPGIIPMVAIKSAACADQLDRGDVH